MLIYMSTNRRGGSSYVLGTLKTLTSYITKVEIDKYSKSTESEGERETKESAGYRVKRGETPVSA